MQMMNLCLRSRLGFDTIVGGMMEAVEGSPWYCR
jgi:hypothetical protein